MIDISTLTVAEVAKIEELSGQPITAFEDENRPKALPMAALAFVIKRREDSTFTWNKALELPFSDLSVIIGLGEDEEDQDPLDGSSQAPSAKKSTSRKN